MRKHFGFKALAILFILSSCTIKAQAGTPAEQLFQTIRGKLTLVNDYVADVRMKVDVSFMRVPLMSGKLYFKAPDKLKLERNGGLALMPKKSISLTLGSLMPAGQATVIDAGTDIIDGQKVRILQVVPQGETEIVLTKIWIDESKMLALRTETTTRENGTIRVDLEYGKYLQLALPDKVVFVLDIKDYKLPKGVTMDYDDGTQEVMAKAKKLKMKKGRIEIRYLDYKVNTGLKDGFFDVK